MSKAALITGSGRNIGRGCAVELARRGFNIVINGASDRGICERTAKEVEAEGVKAHIIMCDIGDQAAVEAMAAEALDTFGRVDVLVNNAAIRPLSPFLEMSDDDWERVMNVNTWSAVWLARAFLPGMIEAGWGRIVNFTGMNAQQGKAGRPGVTASKHAMWGLTKAWAREFGPQGITANIISPGTFPGEGENVAHDGKHEALIADNPVRRLGRREDIAAFVGFLCSVDGGFTNGQLVAINGGVDM